MGVRHLVLIFCLLASGAWFLGIFFFYIQIQLLGLTCTFCLAHILKKPFLPTSPDNAAWFCCARGTSYPAKLEATIAAGRQRYFPVRWKTWVWIPSDHRWMSTLVSDEATYARILKSTSQRRNKVEARVVMFALPDLSHYVKSILGK